MTKTAICIPDQLEATPNDRQTPMIHVDYQERIRGGAYNATVGWVESLLENDVTYGRGKSIHTNFHSPYKESKDSRYIHWLEPPGVK